MAIEREVNVAVTGSSEGVKKATLEGKKAIEDNIIRTVRLAEIQLARFNKVTEKTSKNLESKLVNASEASNKALEKMTKTIEASAAAIQRSLAVSAAASEKQIELLASSSELASQKIDMLSDSAERAGIANKQMESSVESNVRTLDSLIQILQFAGKALSILGTAFVAIVGKEKAFELINLAAVKFSNIIERAGNALKRIGGPLARMAPILFLMRDALRSNNVAFAIFAGLGADNIDSADAMRSSILNLAKEQLSFSNKMAIASAALGIYGNSLLATDGILNKIKGTTALVAGATLGFIGSMTESLGGFGEQAILVGASFLAIAGIDKLFKPLNSSIDRLTISMIGSQNRAASMSKQLFQTTDRAQRFGQAINQLKSNLLNTAVKGLSVFKNTLIDTRAGLKIFTNSAKFASAGIGGTTKAIIAASRHTEIFEKGLAGLVARTTITAGVFNFLGLRLLSADGTMNKMAGITLLALGVAMGGVVLIIKQLLVSIGGLIESMGAGLTAATQKQIELFSNAERNAFAFTQTIESYANSTEEAATQTAKWNKFIEETSVATGTTTDSLQALVAETVAATDAAHLNDQQMQILIQRTIDLSERAHKPAMDTLIALINGMNGASQSVIALGLHINDAAIQHSNLNQEIKDNFKNLSDAEKAQARYAVLMTQAGKAAGFATNNADLLSKSIKIQENALKELHAELGRGAAIINSEYVAGLAQATKFFTAMLKPILPALGVLEALGGKFLSVTGFIVKHTLVIGLLMSSYKAVNVLLARGLGGGAFERSIPVINKSINDLIRSMGAVSPNLGSIKGIAQTTFQVVKTQAGIAVRALFGLEASAKLTARTMGTQLVLGMKAAGKATLNFSKQLLLLLASPIVLKFALIAAVIFLVVKALKKIEERTKIFSKLWESLSSQFAASASIFASLAPIFSEIGRILTVVLGAAIKFVAAALSFMIGNILRVVKAFMILSQFLSKVLPDAVVASEESLKAINKNLDILNEAAIGFAKEGAKDLINMFIASAEAAEKFGPPIKDWTADLAAAASAVAKFEKGSKKAFESVRDFTPRLNMANFLKETAKFDTALVGLKKKLEAQKLVLIQSGATEKELIKVEARIGQTMEAIKGLQIRTAQEVRISRVREVEVEQQIVKNMVFSVEQDIKEMRLDFANDTRSRLIEIETQRLLEQRGLATDAAQEATTIRQASIIEANNIELEVFRNRLEAEKELAINIESQKQLQLAQIKADALGAGPAGQAAGESVEILQAQIKEQELTRLRNKGSISEKEHQSALTEIRLNEMQRRTDREIQLQTQRDEALGLTPAALEARLLREQEVFQMELERLIANKETLKLTDLQFQESMKEAEMRNLEARSDIRQKFIEQEIQQNERRGNNFAASLGKIKLSQEKHGKIMGALMGAQQTAEFKGIQGAFSNIATLRNSKSRKAFEVGKVAALAGAGINIAQGMIGALAPPPIGAGPLLGPILAATVAVAGLVQLQNIKSQKFSGGQADQGIDSIPKSLSGKSFILSAGERVVQPEANKDLTNFLTDQKQGSGGGNTFNINIGTVDSDERVEQVAQRVKQIIREDSERGEPIISSRGIISG